MSNINYTQNNTKKELLNILSNLKKTQIIDMINQYNTNTTKTQNQNKNQNQNQTKTQNQNKTKTQNKNKNKNKNQTKTQNKNKNKQTKSSIEVVKKIIHIPKQLNQIEFKKSKANNIEYKNI